MRADIVEYEKQSELLILLFTHLFTGRRVAEFNVEHQCSLKGTSFADYLINQTKRQ